eukprot:CAMPEP_0172208236 /NCGR_PEP_ID=MMETSP1050-20130122/34349_1 /TAXON_ID=233186 /ORGANISM="Cryptomonas curvata, Strain CCAP979/52" /LENGTH=55 /DNA_ID=CAMNT_0012887783 /DNA_START=594 /DNA_END=758 /DNA_ORIENTATION=-
MQYLVRPPAQNRLSGKSYQLRVSLNQWEPAQQDAGTKERVADDPSLSTVCAQCKL